MKPSDSSAPLYPVFILSAAALAYEILLVRLFSIVHWHHFAFMVISIALLGYGVSGSLTTVFQQKLLPHFSCLFIANALLFGISTTACFVAVQSMHFNALEILWDPRQWQRLFTSYLLLTLPFFFVANAITLTIARYSDQLAKVYCIDLVGAGAGAITIIALLQFYEPGTVLRFLSILGLGAGALIVRKLDRPGRIATTSLIASITAVLLFTPADRFALRISEFKGLEQGLQINGATHLLRRSSSVSQIDVIENTEIPFRNAPGMSLMSPAEPPEQLAVFRDGDELFAIDRRQPGSLVYLDYISSALPYSINSAPRNVLVLGSSTGNQLLQATRHSSGQIDAVESDILLTDLITENYSDYFGLNAIRDRVRFHAISPRGYVASSDEKYDLIVTGVPGGSTGGAAGVHGLSISHHLTTEAIEKYLSLLDPVGLLSITLWTSTPARANLRLFATAVNALRETGFQQPARHIAWIRSWNTATLIIKNYPLSDIDIKHIRDFCRARAFDIAWIPGIKEGEVNRYQLLEQPVFHIAAKSLLSEDPDDFIDSYKYSIAPVSDNNPYFHNSFKWSSLPELWGIKGRGGIAMIEVGYPTLIFTLIQAIIAAVILIFMPLVFLKRSTIPQSAVHRNIVFYFFSIGLAFLFIELAFIQKFTLILGQPLYAITVTLAACLIFSGLGSLAVQHEMDRSPPGTNRALLSRSLGLISVIALTYIIALPYATDSLMALPDSARIAATALIAAPLAFLMGMPLPIGLAATRQIDPQLLPWAWGINGCASVLSAILAILLAIEIGFSGVMLCAVLCYLFAFANRPKV